MAAETCCGLYDSTSRCQDCLYGGEWNMLELEHVGIFVKPNVYIIIAGFHAILF